MTARTVAVIPAFNEAENLPGVLAELFDVVNDLPEPSAVMVVNSGSTDAIRAVLESLQGATPRSSL